MRERVESPLRFPIPPPHERRSALGARVSLKARSRLHVCTRSHRTALVTQFESLPSINRITLTGV